MRRTYGDPRMVEARHRLGLSQMECDRRAGVPIHTTHSLEKHRYHLVAEENAFKVAILLNLPTTVVYPSHKLRAVPSSLHRALVADPIRAPNPDPDLVKAIHEAIADLPDRLATAIRLRYGIERDPQDLVGIGKVINVTRARVCQLLDRAESQLNNTIPLWYADPQKMLLKREQDKRAKEQIAKDKAEWEANKKTISPRIVGCKELKPVKIPAKFIPPMGEHTKFGYGRYGIYGAPLIAARVFRKPINVPNAQSWIIQTPCGILIFVTTYEGYPPKHWDPSQDAYRMSERDFRWLLRAYEEVPVSECPIAVPVTESAVPTSTC